MDNIGRLLCVVSRAVFKLQLGRLASNGKRQKSVGRPGSHDSRRFNDGYLSSQDDYLG